MFETLIHSVGSTPCDQDREEELMLSEDVVQEVLAGLARGEGVKTIAPELGVA